MSVPYEELAMSPNREQATRLGAIVGRRFVFSRDQWPSWQRLVDRFTWRTVIRAAESCDPTKRFPNNVESACLQLAKDEEDSAREYEERRRREAVPRPGNNAERAKLFSEIRGRVGV